MRVQRVDIKLMMEIATASDDMMFMNLPGSKLFRLPVIPERYQTTEIKQVLYTLCKKYHKGVYYFLLPDVQALKEFREIMANMGINHWCMQPVDHENPYEICEN